MNAEQLSEETPEWHVCRTCLNNEHLYSIFLMPEHCDKYTEIILKVTGIKVEINDKLPKKICSLCMYYINDIYKFQKKCSEVQIELFERLKIKQYGDTQTDKIYKSEVYTTSIDISDLLPIDGDDFNDYDDNIPLDTFQTSEEVKQNFKDSCNHVDLEESLNNEKTVRKKQRTKKEKKKDTTENDKEPAECKYCHKILTSKLSLRNHYKIHTGFDFVCEHCGKKFITRRLLLMHCRAKHGYEKTDKCSFCDYRASNAEQVKIHERVHTGEKPFVCNECGASFHRRSSYLQHVAIHLPEKTVQCEQCPARFKSVTLMRIHASRHRAAPYSFRCRVCEHSFARRRNVARHLQRVHRLSPDQQHIVRIKIN